MQRAYLKHFRPAYRSASRPTALADGMPLPVSSGSFLAVHRLKQHDNFIRAIRYSPSSQLATGSPNSGLSRLLTVSRWFESGPGSQIKSRSYMTLPDRRQAHKPVRGSIQGS